STVPNPGTTPCSRSRATRAVSSSRIAAAVALPSRICAPTGSDPLTGARALRRRSPPWAGGAHGSVGEVAGAGEIHGHPGGGRRGDDLLVADRPPRLYDGPHPAVEQHLQPVGEREERVGGGHRSGGPLPRP